MPTFLIDKCTMISCGSLTGKPSRAISFNILFQYLGANAPKLLRNNQPFFFFFTASAHLQNYRMSSDIQRVNLALNSCRFLSDQSFLLLWGLKMWNTWHEKKKLLLISTIFFFPAHWKWSRFTLKVTSQRLKECVCVCVLSCWSCSVEVRTSCLSQQ